MTPDAVQAPEKESHPAESEPADELTIAITRLNSSIERFRQTFDACKPKTISTPNVEELRSTDGACIRSLDDSSVELLKIVNQLIGDRKRQEGAKILETGMLKIVTSVGNAVNITFKYITPALKNILQVGVQASAVTRPSIIR